MCIICLAKSGWFERQDQREEAGFHQTNSESAAAAKSLQSCPTLCGPIDGSPPGSAIPGILQARTLEWVAISFSTSYLGLLEFDKQVYV